MNCPKCGFERPDGSVECARCGVVFAKWEAGPAAAVPERVPPRAVVTDHVADGSLGAVELRRLAIAFTVALVVYLIPFTRFVLSAMVTLFHEFGHAVAGWCLGHPSIPAFDFVYGGGLTSRAEFKTPLALLLGAGWVGLAWLVRANRRTVVFVGGLGLAWLFVVTAEWRRDLVFSAMGHLGELVLAGAFFYMALANVGFRQPEAERPLALFIAFFVTIHSIHFAWRLRSDADFLAWYRDGKGGMLMNDLESVALDIQIFTGAQPGIEGVALALLVASFVPLAVALLLYRYRSRVSRLVSRLLTAG
jgi:hypothetical protein